MRIDGFELLVAVTANDALVPEGGICPVGSAQTPISAWPPAGIWIAGTLLCRVKPGGVGEKERLKVSAAGPVLVTNKSKSVDSDAPFTGTEKFESG